MAKKTGSSANRNKIASKRSPAQRPPQIVTRERLRDIVRNSLESLPYVHALWEGGSAGFGRVDVWSDLDLHTCVDDDRVDDTFAAVEAAFAAHAPVELRHIAPSPTWHGHAQRFYRIRNAPPWLLVDFCVLRQSSERKFLEKEIHGAQPFLFDRIGLAAATGPTDPDTREKMLRARLALLSERVSMFAGFVDKELRRHHAIDAFALYHGLILLPLAEVLRIRHDPWRHDFGMRYLHVDLPQPVARKFESLLYVRNPAELSPKARAALGWFDALVSELGKTPVLVPGAKPLNSSSAEGEAADLH